MKYLLLLLFSTIFSHQVLSIGGSVTHISPTTGDTSGGYPLIILTDTTLVSPTVTVGGNNCAIDSFNSNSLACIIPSGIGSVDVIVTSDAVVMPSVIFNYNAPSILNVTPNILNRQGAQDLHITGNNFGTSGLISVAGNDCTITTYSQSSIICSTPTGSGTNLNVTVSQNGGFDGNLTNAVSYQACDPGTFDLSGTCTFCPEGTFQDLAGQSACKPCPAGSASNNTGAVACNLCAVGEFQNSQGANSCLACPQGKFQNEPGKTECKPCSAGSYSSTNGAAACNLCELGKFQNQIGQNSCSNCDPGQFQDLTGQASCKACNVGTVSNNSGSSSCESCSLGSFQNLPGQANCLACTPGSFSNFPGAISCTSCPSGAFQEEFGAIECLTCPDGTTQPATGQAECFAGDVCDALFGLSKSGFESGLLPVVQ